MRSIGMLIIKYTGNAVLKHMHDSTAVPLAKWPTGMLAVEANGQNLCTAIKRALRT
jgi:hypothetical protein